MSWPATSQPMPLWHSLPNFNIPLVIFHVFRSSGTEKLEFHLFWNADAIRSLDVPVDKLYKRYEYALPECSLQSLQKGH